jgi:hypothetical protein
MQRDLLRTRALLAGFHDNAEALSRLAGASSVPRETLAVAWRIGAHKREVCHRCDDPLCDRQDPRRLSACPHRE